MVVIRTPHYLEPEVSDTVSAGVSAVACGTVMACAGLAQIAAAGGAPENFVEGLPFLETVAPLRKRRPYEPGGKS